MSGSFRTNQLLILMLKIVISFLAITLSLSLSAGVPDLEKQSNTESSATELCIESKTK